MKQHWTKQAVTVKENKVGKKMKNKEKTISEVEMR